MSKADLCLRRMKLILKRQVLAISIPLVLLFTLAWPRPTYAVLVCPNGPCIVSDDFEHIITTAIAALKQTKPDLLLLDIQLPDMDGFSVLKSIPPDELPIVIFTTAFDQYAIKAFEAHALDYLLKPFDHERLRDSLQRARLAVRSQSNRVLTDQLLNILQRTTSNSHARRLLVRSGGRVVFLAYDEIEWIEAAANYVRVHAGKTSYTLRGSIGNIADKLPKDQFVRIHRSTVVNARIIKELQPCNSGEFILVLQNGKELSCSRGYREELRRLIDNTPVL